MFPKYSIDSNSMCPLDKLYPRRLRNSQEETREKCWSPTFSTVDSVEMSVMFSNVYSRSEDKNSQLNHMIQQVLFDVSLLGRGTQNEHLIFNHLTTASSDNILPTRQS